MIDENALEAAIIAIVRGSGFFPNILYEGDAAVIDKPFLALEVQGMATNDPTIAKTLPIWTGIIAGAIVTKQDQLSSECKRLAVQFGSLFRPGMSIAIGGGVLVRVTDWPHAEAGYRDGGGYRKNITVPLRSEGLT